MASGSAANGTAHELNGAFTFWYLKKSTMSRDNWEQSVKELGSFNTVEDFWAYYTHIIRPSDLATPVDYYLFREGIKPMWEDPVNRNGGKWLIRLRKGMASRCWENLLIAVIGDSFDVGQELCGVVCSSKFQDDIISVWNRNAQDEVAKNKIRDTLKRVLSIPSNAELEYRVHDQAIKNVTQRQHTREHRSGSDSAQDEQKDESAPVAS